MGIDVTDMAGATSMVADLALPPVLPAADVAPEVPSTAGVTPEILAASIAPEVLSTSGVAAEVLAQLALVLGAAGGGLSGAGSEQALAVVEAVEGVKAWADSLSVDATAVMVAQFETEHVHLAPEGRAAWEWRRFVRTCRSAAAREIQVATGMPVTACQRRVWLSACEPERVGAGA